jgi:LEA14-like dessication related protein
MVRSLILLTAAAMGLAACASLPHTDPLQVTLVDMEPLEGEGLEARMQLKLRVQNPNSTPVDYNGIFVELYVQGKSFASGVASESGTVPAFGEAVIGVPVTISVLSIVREAMGMLGGGKLPDKVNYEMRGKLSGITSGTVRFKSQGEMTLPTSPASAE